MNKRIGYVQFDRKVLRNPALHIAKPLCSMTYSCLLKKHFPLDRIYLFGSYAKSTYNAESGIDVAIVENHIEGDFFTINPLLWKLRRQIDNRTEPILIEKDSDMGGFISEIQKNGIKIA